MEGEIFSLVADLISPGLLWASFFLSLLFTLTVSLILLYHWWKFHTDKKMFITAGTVYLSGVGILILLIIISIIIFSTL